MEIKNILKLVDHTLLSPTATLGEIENLCKEAVEYSVASVCVPPCYVSDAKRFVNKRTNVCTVVGFPNGYSGTKSKLFESLDAVESGADEIDMVINLGWLKDKKFKEVEQEIVIIREKLKTQALKVIVETCLLTEPEKIEMCKIVCSSGADYIKTSTGFSKAGAQVEDIELFRKNLYSKVKIKAAGGISTLEQAENLVKAGANRLGSSKLINLAQQTEF